MNSYNLKLLTNYQLFQLAQNERLDDETLIKIDDEFRRRNVSILELKDFQKRYNETFAASKVELKTEEKVWNPFYTAFAWRKHFKHIALLKSQGNSIEAKKYKRRFYKGIALYLFLILIISFWIRK